MIIPLKFNRSKYDMMIPKIILKREQESLVSEDLHEAN